MNTNTLDTPLVTNPASLSVETITPDRASELLKLNTHNRPTNPRHIKALADEMEAGNWRLNGEPIVFSPHSLLDGQHRLLACLKANLPFQSIVVRGIDESVFPTIDVGLRRTGSHTLAMLGEKQPARLAAALRYVDRYLKGQTDVKKRLSNSELQTALSAHPGVRDSLGYCLENYTQLMPISLLAALHYLFAIKDRSKADEFVYRLVCGLGIDQDSPIYLLRERLVQNAASKARVSEDYLAALAIKAFNSFVSGEKLKYLRFREKGASPEAFPVVKG